MIDDLLREKVHNLIENRDFSTLKRTVQEMETHDLAALLEQLEGEDLGVVFRLIPSDETVEVFGLLPFERQEYLLGVLSSERVGGIIRELAPDDRTELLEELPGSVAQRLLGSLRGRELEIARELLAYPEDSIGRLMTPEYISVQADWSVQRIFEHIREAAPTKETLQVIYVVDEQGKLLDELTLEQLVLAEPTATTAREIMDNRIVASLRASEDRAAAVEMFKKYDAVVLPVVTSGDVLVGIITVDDVMDVAEEENTEDFLKVTGMGVLDYSYFGTGFLRMISKRLPWLILLLGCQMITAVALTTFEQFAQFALLVVFVPLINSPAGNTGSQTAGLMIRGLALQEIHLRDWWRVLRRELMRGLVLGATLGVIGYATVLLLGRSDEVAISVALAMLAAVTVGNLAGSMLPFAFLAFGLDPAVTSTPFLASLMDVSGILIYFTIGLTVLSTMG